MNGVRFGWLGESRRAALGALISTEVVEWSREWWVHHAAAEVTVRRAEYCSPTGKAAMPFVVASETGSLALFLGSKEFDAIGRHLAGAVDMEDAGWAQRIGEEALEDLAMRIYRRAGITKPSQLEESVASSDLERVDLGAGIFTVALGRLAWNLTIDRRLVDRLVPPTASMETNLVSREAALHGVPLRVSAVIDFGSISLTHLSDLRVGEILVGDRGLEEALHIHVENHGAVANAYLRRVGTQRAVMFDGINAEGIKS